MSIQNNRVANNSKSGKFDPGQSFSRTLEKAEKEFQDLKENNENFNKALNDLENKNITNSNEGGDVVKLDKGIRFNP